MPDNKEHIDLRDQLKIKKIREQIAILKKSGNSDLVEVLLKKIEEIKKSSPNLDPVGSVYDIIDHKASSGNPLKTEDQETIDLWIEQTRKKLPNLSNQEIYLIQDVLNRHLDRKRRTPLKKTSEPLCTEEFLSCLNVDFLKQYLEQLRYDSDCRDKLQMVIPVLRKKLGNDPNFWIPYFAWFSSRITKIRSCYSEMREIITSEILIKYFDEKSKVKKFDKREDERTIKHIEFYLQLCREGTLNIKIPWNIFKNLHEKLSEAGVWTYYYHGGSHESLIPNIWDLNIISDPEELKNELETSLKAGWLKYASLFGEHIWDIIDKSYQIPSYINMYAMQLGDHYKGIPNGFRLVKSYAKSLKPGETGEKFSGKVLDHTDYNSDYDLCHHDQFAIWENPELLKVINVESLESSFFPLWFYLYLKHNTDIDVSKLVGKVLESRDFMNFWYEDRVQKNYSFHPPYDVRGDIRHSVKYSSFYYGTPHDLREKYLQTDVETRLTEFMQDVYATGNDEYLYSLYTNFFLFGSEFSQLSDEDQDVFLMKVIKNDCFFSNLDDCEEFLRQIRNHKKTPLSIMIYCSITGEISWLKEFEKDSICVPQSIYREVCEEAISQNRDIPIKWEVVQDPYVDIKSLEHLKTLYQKLQEYKKRKYEQEQARKAKLRRIWEEQQERERELNETKEYALAHWDEGEVILDYRKQTPYDEKGQKFILVVDPATKKLIFISEDLTFHSNIKGKYCPDGLCLGGGRIYIDDDGVYHLYDRSISYGYVAGEDKKAMENLLKKQFPDKKIEIS